jgi:hypothetical protein
MANEPTSTVRARRLRERRSSGVVITFACDKFPSWMIVDLERSEFESMSALLSLVTDANSIRL